MDFGQNQQRYREGRNLQSPSKQPNWHCCTPRAGYEQADNDTWLLELTNQQQQKILVFNLIIH